MSKGESLVDTVRTVEALGADMLVMRHSVSGAPYLAADVFGGSVLNGGDGWHAHPSQALLDLYTLRSRLPGGSLEGRKVVILGDALHSRVARSNIWTLTAMGADLWICGPSTLLRGFEGWAARGAAGRRFTVTSDVDAALKDADVVMALRIQKERMASGLLPSMREYAARYGLTRARLRAASPDVDRDAPGSDERGRGDRRRRGGGPALGDHAAGHERRRRRMALLYLLAGAGPAPGRGGRRSTARPARSARSRRDHGPRLGVDPASGARAPPRSWSRTALERSLAAGADADGLTPDGVLIPPGFVDLHAHFREPGNEDAETVATGSLRPRTAGSRRSA